MCNEKIKVYSPVNSVSDVIMLFGKLHEQLGFPRLAPTSINDEVVIPNIKYNNSVIYCNYKILNGRKIIQYFNKRVIFEYLSSDYLLEDRFPKNNLEDIIVCWKDDCNLKKYLEKNYNHTDRIGGIIELQDYVDVIPPDTVNYYLSNEHYYLINYDLADNDYKNNVDWSNSKLLKCIYNGKKISLYDKVKALIKQGDYIIGGFDIVRYENIQLLDSSAFVQLYKDFTDSPIGLFSSDINEIKSRYCNRGNDSYILHIYYDNFFELSNKEVRKTIKEILPDFEADKDNFYDDETTPFIMKKIGKEEYNKLLGID